MYTYITHRDSPNFTPAAEASRIFGMPRVIEGITIHWWGDPKTNPQFNSVVDYLCRKGGNTSAHYVATGTGRQVACIVNPGDVAWHSGSSWGNARTIGIELDPRARDEDYDVAAELIADIRSAFGDVPIYWHSYFTATACPGAWNPERLDKLSYTKYSAKDWGKGGTIKPKTTAPSTPVVPAPKPANLSLYRLYDGSKQLAAYSNEVNAFKGYVQYGGGHLVIRYGTVDVTQDLINKYRTASPTTKNSAGTTLPDSGKPVTDKHDYEEASTVPPPAPEVPQPSPSSDSVVPPADPIILPVPVPAIAEPQTFWQKHFNKEKIMLDLAALGTAIGGVISWFMGHHELLSFAMNLLAGLIFGSNRFKGK